MFTLEFETILKEYAMYAGKLIQNGQYRDMVY